VIAHDLSLKAFNLQSIHLSSYVFLNIQGLIPDTPEKLFSYHKSTQKITIKFHFPRFRILEIVFFLTQHTKNGSLTPSEIILKNMGSIAKIDSEADMVEKDRFRSDFK